MVSYPSINLVEAAIDEVALEGLDGITIEGLWLRFAHRFHTPLPLSKTFMIQIWSICVQVKKFRFYELETAREPLVIFDRYEFVDPDLGIILEPENVPADIYPHCPIQDFSNGVKGSCSTYYTRKEITQVVRCVSLDEAVEKYGQKLVIVASQTTRERALMGIDVSPTLELNVIQYCFLERVGRSRYHGEVTQGKLSLNALNEDPKTLFYYRKFLLRYKLITKQIHHQKSSGHSCNGSLLHLPRFFIERKPKVIFLAEQVIQILKSKPNHVVEYDEIKKKLQIENTIKKLFKTSFFQKVVLTDLRVPYRTLYPNAEPIEWQQKNNPAKEKMIKVVQLLIPDIDITEVWNKDEIQEEDEPQELDISKHKFNIPYLKQANAIIEGKKNDGICQGGLAREMGLTKLQSRTLLRNLVKTNIIATYMNDIGRQRLTKYVSKKFEKGSKMSKQFRKEMLKIKELTKHITIGDNSIENNAALKNSKMIVTQKENIEISGFPQNDNSDSGIVKIDEKSVPPKVELTKTFSVVNRILHKYRLTKYVRRYKCTSFIFLSSSFDGKKQWKQRNKCVSEPTTSFSTLPNSEKTTSVYKNLKTDLVPVKPVGRTGKPVEEVFGFMENVQMNEEKNVSNITYRLLRRANMIIESVKENQVIDDMTKLMKMIHDEEDKEGYDVKIDKKSLIRLLQKLAKDNLVKHIKLTLSSHGIEKNLTFICDPRIDIDHPIIHSAVEQAKLKFCLLVSQKMASPTKKSSEKLAPKDSSNFSSTEINKREDKIKKTNLKYDLKAAKRYGYSPKFLRMQALHIYLYYLVYNHPGEQTLSKKEQIELLRANGFNISDEVAAECNTIYTTDISWKMFVQPLPKYSGWPHGWALMCDILLRIPLSIFLKVHHLTFNIPQLDNYVNHPIKKHYLVRDMPVDIRNSLLFGRKYIFNVHETVTRLCYIGLTQFGPQRLKEKDQVFIYVNRQTELMDTTSSGPGYHIIEDKPYTVIRYKFDKIEVVEKYWCDMWNTCINTPLGGRLAVQGKEILLEELTKKADMIKAVAPRSPDEAVFLDTGKVPGDRKGAAGIDSACFAHLKRNWNWGLGNSNLSIRQPTQTYKKGSTPCERDTYLSNIKVKPLKFTEFSGLKKVSGPLSVNATDLRKKPQQPHGKTHENVIDKKKYETLKYHRNPKQKSFVRRVLPRKHNVKRRTKYDEIDYRALQRMHKLRVDWEPHEDKILLVCKVAMMYICPNPRKQVVTFTAVRDVLRQYSFTSYNKTSRACQRRLLYMLRKPQTVNSVTLGIEEIKQNFYISKRFDGIAEKLKKECKTSHEYEARVTNVFKTLVEYVAKKYYDISEIGPKQPMPVPKTVQEFNMFYKVVHPTKPLASRGFVKDVRTIGDAHSAIINSVIHSSMCCGKDRRSWAYQLFKIYQQYPEILLRNAMAKIRSDQMVTVKKNHICAARKYDNYMPMSSSQYQLSTSYIYKFQTKWPYSIYKESFDVVMKLINWYCQNQGNAQINVSAYFMGIEIQPVVGGIISAIHDYVIQNRIDFDVEIPDQIIMLDPKLKEKDETYFRIAQRYQDVLTSMDHLKEPLFQKGTMDSELSQRGCTEIDDEGNSNVDPAIESGNNSFLDLHVETSTSPEKCREKANFGSVKHYDESNFDSDDETCRSTVDEESNVITLQDGIKIVFDKHETEDSRCTNDHSPIDGRSTERVDDSTQANSEMLQKDSNLSNFEPITYNRTNDSTGSNFYAQSNTDTGSTQKRPRIVDEEVFDLNEPLKKKAKLCDTVQSTPKPNEEESMTEQENINTCADQSDSVEPMNDELFDQETVTADVEAKNVLKSKKQSENKFTRLSAILCNKSVEKCHLTSYCKIDDSSDVQKRYTRIALLRMREELSELTISDSHHAHEYFVVNMFKIFYSLRIPTLKLLDDCEQFKGLMVPPQLIPLRIETANELIRQINKSAIVSKENISYTDYKKNLLENQSFPNLNSMDAVYKFVEDKKEIGANIQELMDEFQNSIGPTLYRIVTMLTENTLFLRSGVTTVRYIHHHYIDAWLINSYKIYRLEKESLLPVPKGTVYVTNKPPATDDVDSIVTQVSKENCDVTPDKELSEIISEKSITSDSLVSAVGGINNGDTEKHETNESEEKHQVRKRMQRKRSRSLSQKAAKHFDFTTAEEIKVVIRPWIRIDGVLNRRALDCMLGAVLTYCLTHPGITLSKVQSRFVPALQLFHTRELVEMLIKLECLEKKFLKKPHVTLFSKSSSVRPRDVDINWALEDDVFLEPANGAILKFGIFLSTKMYSSDFIS